MTIARAGLRCFVILVLGFSSGCRGGGSNGVGLLPSPPPEQMKFSNYQPQTPFVKISPGLSTRAVFVVEPIQKSPYHIDVLDILIAPGQQAVQVPQSGAGVYEVRSGGGTAATRDTSEEISVGSTFLVAEGETLKIAAKGDGPIMLRAYIVRIP